MTAPVRFQISRAKGFSLQAHSIATNGLPAVKVTRPGPWGNPFDFRDSAHCWSALAFGCRGDPAGRQEASVKAFREWIDPGEGKRVMGMDRQMMLGDVPIGPKAEAGPAPAYDDIRKALRGRNLACWCKIGAPCHAEVLLEIANRPACEEIEDLALRDIDAEG